ncbi:DUF418 domain-containing protein [Parashewanella spongiae]|nr:DUF418 domain-containing protein [Parashewanella spongiae]
MFSVLFGAGLALLYHKFKSEHVAGKPRGSSTIYIRLALLFIIGYLHISYIWSGDVLTLYAILGMLVFPLLGASNKGLVSLFVFMYSLVGLISLFGMNIDINALSALEIEQIKLFFTPSTEQIQQLTHVYQGSIADIHTFENNMTLNGQEASLAVLKPLIMMSFVAILRAGAMMILGFYLFNLGFLQGKLESTTYKKVAIFGMIIGYIITGAGLIYNYSHEWAIEAYFSLGNAFLTLGSPFLVVGYIAAIHLILTKSNLAKFSHLIANTGRIALSLYLFQSVVGAALFYGVGLSWYASLDRTDLVLIWAVLTVTQIVLAYFWLSIFRIGPIEWIWRSCTYRKIMPLLSK